MCKGDVQSSPTIGRRLLYGTTTWPEAFGSAPHWNKQINELDDLSTWAGKYEPAQENTDREIVPSVGRTLWWRQPPTHHNISALVCLTIYLFTYLFIYYKVSYIKYRNIVLSITTCTSTLNSTMHHNTSDLVCLTNSSVYYIYVNTQLCTGGMPGLPVTQPTESRHWRWMKIHRTLHWRGRYLDNKIRLSS